MRTVLATEHGHERYRKRKQTVEPLFGNAEHNGGFYRFHRRGRTTVRLEWRLLMMTTTSPRFTATNSRPWGLKRGQSVSPPITVSPLLTTCPPSAPRAITRAFERQPPSPASVCRGRLRRPLVAHCDSEPRVGDDLARRAKEQPPAARPSSFALRRAREAADVGARAVAHRRRGCQSSEVGTSTAYGRGPSRFVPAREPSGRSRS
jgi:hypothetical protein